MRAIVCINVGNIFYCVKLIFKNFLKRKDSKKKTVGDKFVESDER